MSVSAAASEGLSRYEDLSSEGLPSYADLYPSVYKKGLSSYKGVSSGLNLISKLTVDRRSWISTASSVCEEPVVREKITILRLWHFLTSFCRSAPAPTATDVEILSNVVSERLSIPSAFLYF